MNASAKYQAREAYANEKAREENARRREAARLSEDGLYSYRWEPNIGPGQWFETIIQVKDGISIDAWVIVHGGNGSGNVNGWIGNTVQEILEKGAVKFIPDDLHELRETFREEYDRLHP